MLGDADFINRMAIFKQPAPPRRLNSLSGKKTYCPETEGGLATWRDAQQLRRADRGRAVGLDFFEARRRPRARSNERMSARRLQALIRGEPSRACPSPTLRGRAREQCRQVVNEEWEIIGPGQSRCDRVHAPAAARTCRRQQPICAGPSTERAAREHADLAAVRAG
jgi:hypothetical protein